MKIVGKTGREDIAQVFIAEMGNGKVIEFVESVQPPIPREEKWVLIISTLFGCPVGCRFCDAGEFYRGKLTASEIMEQIDFLIKSRFPDGTVPVPKFKIQFARMGDPAMNSSVLDVLETLPKRYHAPGLMPSVSSIAPKGCESFFNQLKDIKNTYYRNRFQLQFSIHSTNQEQRDWLIPVPKWSLQEIAEYGNFFSRKGERKITLNFALAQGMEINPEIMLNHFDPNTFFIKITPVNPTGKADTHGIVSEIDPDQDRYKVIDLLREAGYEVLLSIGELKENAIGSNCGQHVMNYLKKSKKIRNSYTYPVESIHGIIQ
jgi:23S rRNA (adenine2503-C2)-methyltransferase